MADEEPVDIMPKIREECGLNKCSTSNKEYKACLVRVAEKGFGACEGQYFDFLKCVDKCSVPKIMKHLK